MVATRESEGESIERDREVLGNPDTGIRAVLFDFGGVLSTSPFEAFARYEVERGLPEGFLRGLTPPIITPTPGLGSSAVR